MLRNIGYVCDGCIMTGALQYIEEDVSKRGGVTHFVLNNSWHKCVRVSAYRDAMIRIGAVIIVNLCTEDAVICM